MKCIYKQNILYCYQCALNEPCIRDNNIVYYSSVSWEENRPMDTTSIKCTKKPIWEDFNWEYEV
jgi:pyruvoyl-dependent arginine decarboxylase (PvlArgDC)